MKGGGLDKFSLSRKMGIEGFFGDAQGRGNIIHGNALHTKGKK